MWSIGKSYCKWRGKTYMFEAHGLLSKHCHIQIGMIGGCLSILQISSDSERWLKQAKFGKVFLVNYKLELDLCAYLISWEFKVPPLAFHDNIQTYVYIYICPIQNHCYILLSCLALCMHSGTKP